MAPATAAQEPDAQQESVTAPALLGYGEAELRAEFGAALKAQPIELRLALDPWKAKIPVDALVAKAVAEDMAPAVPPPADVKDPFAGQLRLIRKPEAGDIQSVEYELYRGRIYRIRWQLAARFERPLMTSLVSHLANRLGKPYYDQLIEGKFGTGRATLQRAGWRRGSRILEVRQLNPRVGGAIFLTLSDHAIVRTIVESGGTAAPEPDSIGPWWQKPVKPFVHLSDPEREALLVSFDAVLAGVGWE